MGRFLSQRQKEESTLQSVSGYANNATSGFDSSNLCKKGSYLIVKSSKCFGLDTLLSESVFVNIEELLKVQLSVSIGYPQNHLHFFIS
jgi:hypothetical protein